MGNFPSLGNISLLGNKYGEHYIAENMNNIKDEKSDPSNNIQTIDLVSLMDADIKNTKWFDIKGFTTSAKVISVYDGDTCTCVFDTYGLGLYKHRIRLSGIDTPEIRGKSLEEKKTAITVRDFVREKILGKIVNLECKGSDKYGRVLGVITCPSGEILNELLISNGMALKYDGGKKTEFVFESFD